MYVCIYVYIFIEYYKELACGIMEADKSKTCRVGWQARDPGEAVWVQRQSAIEPGRADVVDEVLT